MQSYIEFYTGCTEIILILKFIQGETQIYRCTEVYMVITFLQDETEVYAARS